ncbi:hypothetical protein SAMN05443661_10946 [Natronobacterium gregoryi]|uniref:Uncharacterized protein n=2 Tax=Natronobacterium gregoryi TaxID=44930 RepID=L0AHZ9_NATGS|nr:hypothetical protein Natgr_1454 [Natronobacterium gregoryi SP2]SFI90992.1 hypothetical protein SAMN05443661_10946 [Natronobacterium gregoryi]
MTPLSTPNSCAVRYVVRESSRRCHRSEVYRPLVGESRAYFWLGVPTECCLDLSVCPLWVAVAPDMTDTGVRRRDAGTDHGTSVEVERPANVSQFDIAIIGLLGRSRSATRSCTYTGRWTRRCREESDGPRGHLHATTLAGRSVTVDVRSRSVISRRTGPGTEVGVKVQPVRRLERRSVGRLSIDQLDQRYGHIGPSRLQTRNSRPGRSWSQTVRFVRQDDRPA